MCLKNSLISGVRAGRVVVGVGVLLFDQRQVRGRDPDCAASASASVSVVACPRGPCPVRSRSRGCAASVGRCSPIVECRPRTSCAGLAQAVADRARVERQTRREVPLAAVSGSAVPRRARQHFRVAAAGVSAPASFQPSGRRLLLLPRLPRRRVSARRPAFRRGADVDRVAEARFVGDGADRRA